MNSVALAYAGVHQIFQLALAAQEIDELDSLFCSIASGDRKWGSRLGKWAPDSTARPLGISDLSSGRIEEYPWPLLASRLTRKILPRRRTDHITSNEWFDLAASKWLEKRGKAKVFVGGETCCLRSFDMADSMGMTRVLDCAGIPVQTLDAEANRAAERFKVRIDPSSNRERMKARKREELAKADVVLCCSDFQRSKLLEHYPFVTRTEVVPLWADISFWQAASANREYSRPDKPLRVLYAGGISLRKGIPYLLEAFETLRDHASLTLVGSVSPEIKPLLSKHTDHKHIPHVTKTRLRELFSEHDLFVMPSLGDSFGFVIMEAMASGMPTIASSNSGAPMPSEDCRFPAHDSNAIREQILPYLESRKLLHERGNEARDFAASFLPECYRARIKQILRTLLD